MVGRTLDVKSGSLLRIPARTPGKSPPEFALVWEVFPVANDNVGDSDDRLIIFENFLSEDIHL